MDTIFRVGNLLVLPLWGLMIFLPRWRGTARIMRSGLVCIAPALIYAGLALPRLGAIWPVVARPTLSGVGTLLASPAGATIAWVHFLAFDLFVGRWIYFDAQERQISPWLAAPILFLTLMLGPIGFMGYLAIRSAKPFAAKRVLQSAWRRLLEVNRPLTILGTVMALTFVATLAGVVFDHRVITGAPAWLKPAKFAISTSIYSFTFVWLLGFVRKHPRVVRLAANVTVVSITIEMIAIITQAARGTTSHFNMTTPFDSFLWMMMGTFIVFVWLMNLLLAVVLTMQRMPERAFAWSLRLGLLISLVGMAAAFLMVGPTRQQLAAMAAHQGPRVIGSHSVGVADGGPGLPVVGWSATGGDLRVPHFVGLHGLQVLPLLGWLVMRRRGVFARLGERHRLALVWTGGLAYLGLVLLLVWQALRGQSVINPDTETIIAATVLGFATVASLVVTVVHAWRTSSVDDQRQPVGRSAEA
jgi:hypothetical protein